MKRPNPSLIALAICVAFIFPHALANDLRLDFVDNHPYIPAPGSVNLVISGANITPGTVTEYICFYSDGITTYSDTVTASIPYNPPFGSPFGHQLSKPINLLPGDVKEVIIWVKTPVDSNATNDTMRFTLYGLSFVPKRMVLVEDGEGTWCEWCPRGYVIMDSLSELFGDSVAMVSIHTGDPMEFEPYGPWLWSKISGIPGATIDRIIDEVQTTQYKDRIDERLALAPPAAVGVTSNVDWVAGEIVIDIEVQMAAELTGDYRLNAIVVEDHVTGTGAGYDQRNIYTNGNYGPMGIYSSLPDPVPASQMVYDHVARALGGGIDGDAGSLPNHLPINSNHTYQYRVSLDSVDDPNNIEVFALFLDHTTGEVVNASKQNLITGINPIARPSFTLFPNPTSDVTYLSLPLGHLSEVTIRIFDLSGRFIDQRSYGKLDGQQFLPIKTNDYECGIYLVSVEVDRRVQTSTLAVSK